MKEIRYAKDDLFYGDGEEKISAFGDFDLEDDAASSRDVVSGKETASARDALGTVVLPGAVEFLPLYDASQVAQVDTVTNVFVADRIPFFATHYLDGQIKFPDAMKLSPDAKESIYRVLFVMRRGVLELTLQNLFDTLNGPNNGLRVQARQRLLQVCKADCALSVHVMCTSFLRNNLPKKERVGYPKGLLSRCLGVMLGVTGCIVKIVVYLFYLSGALFEGLIGRPVLLMLDLGSSDEFIEQLQSLKKTWIDILNSPVRLILALADSIYLGWSLGGGWAWDNILQLCAYGYESWEEWGNELGISLLGTNHMPQLLDPGSSNVPGRAYFSFPPTVAQQAEEYIEKNGEALINLRRASHTGMGSSGIIFSLQSEPQHTDGLSAAASCPRPSNIHKRSNSLGNFWTSCFGGAGDEKDGRFSVPGDDPASNGGLQEIELATIRGSLAGARSLGL
ncbi:MAG: hypothetical protein K0Q74_464 [Gammaproteobacteria bacterium]|nr:hypothetical protein [Gammaproteobacteria bacterium]